MASKHKFPNSEYEVIVYKRQDIIDCIEKNFTDKDVVLACIEKCEKDAALFLQEGKWTGIPFIGNIRIPKSVAMEKSKEQKELIDDAKNVLSKDKYMLFRRELRQDNYINSKKDTYYKYVLSKIITKNRKLYNKICNIKGEFYAKTFLYTCMELTSAHNEDFNIEDYDKF